MSGYGLNLICFLTCGVITKASAFVQSFAVPPNKAVFKCVASVTSMITPSLVSVVLLIKSPTDTALVVKLEVEDVKTYSLEDIIPNIDKEYPLVVLLDHIEDPHNFGAIIRSCEAFGVDAIIIPNDRSVDITGTVVKASVGTIEKVKIIKVTNLNNTIKKLKDYGYWVVGTDMEGTVYTDIDYKMKTALIIGNEGKGISRLVSENCDYLAKIPMSGTVNSLNASVACGIFLAEINRSRGV